MAGRGPQSFKKRQKEQQRKEKQQEKVAKRLEKAKLGPPSPDDDSDLGESVLDQLAREDAELLERQMERDR